ncbi:hypothetical protein Tco_1182927 [Tanacetum coccineum]
MQTPLKSSPKGSSQLEGEHIKKDKGKRAMSLDEAEKVSTNSDSDDETYVTGSMVETSKIKKLKKFDFIIEDGKHIHLTKEQINQQKKIEEDAKAEDPLDKLNDLANKKRKHDDDIHDYFKANKRLKRHQGLGLYDHARTFSSLLLAEVDKRNLHTLKHIRVIEQLRQ